MKSVDESTKNSIQRNIKMLNSGIELFRVWKISEDVIEAEFRAIRTLVDDCKRLFYCSLDEE